MGHRRDGGLNVSNESNIYHRRNCKFEKRPHEIPRLQKNEEVDNHEGKKFFFFFLVSFVIVLPWKSHFGSILVT